MATKKKTTTSKKTTQVRRTTLKEAIMATPTHPSIPRLPLPTLNTRFIVNLLLVLLVGATIFFFAKRYRSFFISGMVNKSPISRFELNQVLVKRYGRTVLEELINERLLKQAASENQITVVDNDVDDELKKLEDSLGGKENLSSAMEQYGLSDQDLRKQISLRLLQQQLAEKVSSVQVSDEEVRAYFDANKSVFEGKKFDEVKEGIFKDLKTQKLQQEFGKWFEGYKIKAQISIYLTS